MPLKATAVGLTACYLHYMIGFKSFRQVNRANVRWVSLERKKGMTTVLDISKNKYVILQTICFMTHSDKSYM